MAGCPLAIYIAVGDGGHDHVQGRWVQWRPDVGNDHYRCAGSRNDLEKTHNNWVQIEEKIQKSATRHNKVLKELGLPPMPFGIRQERIEVWEVRKELRATGNAPQVYQPARIDRCATRLVQIRRRFSTECY